MYGILDRGKPISALYGILDSLHPCSSPARSFFHHANIDDKFSETKQPETYLHAHEFLAKRRYHDASHVQETLEVRQREVWVTASADVNAVVSAATKSNQQPPTTSKHNSKLNTHVQIVNTRKSNQQHNSKS